MEDLVADVMKTPGDEISVQGTQRMTRLRVRYNRGNTDDTARYSIATVVMQMTLLLGS